MKPLHNPLLHISAALALGIVGSVQATTYTWNSDGGAAHNATWTDTTTDGWNGGPPVSGDTAALIDNSTVTTNADNQTAGINLNIGGGTLDSGGSYLIVDANTTLQAGTIIIGRAAETYFAGWQGGILGGTLTVSGSAASSITGGSYTGQDINMGTLTTFDVNDVTAGTDLTVGVKLTDFYNGSWLPSSLVKSGAGTMTLTGANSYTGNTTINGGTLKIAEGASIYNGGYNGSAILTVNNGATLELNRWGYGPGSANQSLGGLDYNPARFVINGGTVKYTGGAAGAPTDPGESPYGPGFTIGALGATLDAAKANDTWTVKNDSRGFGPIASNDGGTLTLTGVGNGIFDKELGGTGGVTMNGSATWELNRTNTYTGATNVNSGKLLVTGSTAAGSAVTVASGATLGGTGTIGGTLDVTGILAPGNSIGTLNAGTTTWNGGNDTAATIWQFELSANSNASDSLNIDGDFLKDSTDGSTYKFDFMNSAPTTWGNVYTLATWTGTTNFTLSDFSWTNLGGIYDGQPGTGFTLNSNSLTFTAVPEPTSALVGLLVAAGLLRRRR